MPGTLRVLRKRSVLVVVLAIFRILSPEGPVGELVAVIDTSYVASALRLTVPIAFAALGGIFAEKTGVINIGLEGLLIISAFTGVAVADLISGSGEVTQSMLWIGFLGAIVASTLFTLIFAVVCIEFKADQIIAGLAVWLIALGLGPFAARIVWGARNSPTLPTFESWTIPYLSDIPVVGSILFDANPGVYMLMVAVPLSWYVLNNTSFGLWIRASGENPKALDTAGINVHRIRYIGVLISGVFCGIGGASLSLGHVGLFTGQGATMVNGRGWIGITAYLFGNYNPIGAFGASFLFAGLQAFQVRLQQLGYNIPPDLFGMIPYVTVIIVLVLVGKTQMPEAAGEPYEAEED